MARFRYVRLVVLAMALPLLACDIGGAAGAPTPTMSIAADDSHIEFSDYAGAITRTADALWLKRPITNYNFEYAAPGSRVRFQIDMVASREITATLRYVAKGDAWWSYDDRGLVLVDGASAATYMGPLPMATGAKSNPEGVVYVPIPVSAGRHLVEILLPHGAAVQFSGLEIPEDATLSPPPPRPEETIAALGDSITQGFNATSTLDAWPMALAGRYGYSLKNLGFSGRQLVASDTLVLAAIPATYYILSMCFNSYNVQTPIAAFKSDYGESLTGFRKAAIAHGRPKAMLNVLTCYNSDAATPAQTIPLAQYRQAIREAVATVHDPDVNLIDVASVPALSTLPDHVHPTTQGSLEIAELLYGKLK